MYSSQTSLSQSKLRAGYTELLPTAAAFPLPSRPPVSFVQRSMSLLTTFISNGQETQRPKPLSPVAWCYLRILLGVKI